VTEAEIDPFLPPGLILREIKRPTLSKAEGAIVNDPWFEEIDTSGVFYDVSLNPSQLRPNINVQFNQDGLIPAGGPPGQGGGQGPGTGQGGPEETAAVSEGIACANAFLEFIQDANCGTGQDE
jgi:hypothetical protein